MIAFSEADARLAGARLLLRQICSDDMPTRATRKQWSHIEETMLRLGPGAVPPADIRGLQQEIHNLREAIVLYWSGIPY
jgi:hypothetical protein